MKKIALFTSLIFSISVIADEEPGWSGKGEFGLVATSGNTETTTLNLGLEFIHQAANWRHRATLAALMAEDNSVDTADRQAFEWQSDYKLNEVSYIFGAFRYETDDFAGFDEQNSLTFGYGRQLIDNDTHKLKGEIGAGVVDRRDAVTRISDSEAIIRGLLDYAYTISETTNFTNRFLVEAGSDNTFLENDAALAVSINDKMALQFGVAVRHNTDAPTGTDDTDTVTSANLVYNFK